MCIYITSGLIIYTGVYHQNTEHSNECENGVEILDEEECKYAANQLGYGSNVEVGHYGHWPRGCFYYGGSDRVFFTTVDPTEPIQEQHFKICKTGVVYV